MADHTRSDIIKSKPINDGLNAFRDSSKSRKDLGISGSFDALHHTSSEELRNLLFDLIPTLSGLPAARSLPSKHGNRNLLSDLLTLNSAVNSDNVDIERIKPLLQAVLNDEPDDLIWEKVYDAVAKSINATPVAKPTTPPESGPPFAARFQQTPWAFNTGSFADTSDLRKNVDPILKLEVEDNLIIDHPQFFATFFGGFTQLPEIVTAVFELCKDAKPPLYTDNVGWNEWPKSCEESRVLDWLRSRFEHFLQFAGKRGFQPSQRRRCVTTPNKPIPGSVSRRKLDVGFVNNASDKCKNEDEPTFDWSHILIPGELKSNPREDNYSSTWCDISRYAREVFNGQDTRRFVTGFTICGSIMRLWEFDRLGGLASQPFDINKDGQMFVSAILGFLWMTEEELGFDPTMFEEVGIRYTEIQRHGQTERLHREELIKQQRSVAGRATTCWKGCLEGKTRDRLVIKDSWEYEERPEEGLLLKEATEAGVKNVARYYHHETVHVGGAIDDVRNNVRKGLSDAEGRNPFQQRQSTILETITSSVTSGGLSTGRSRSRSRSRSIQRKRSSSCIQTSMPPPKRSCSDSPVKQDGRQRRNRVHRRVIMRDVGKSIHHASSPRAMLTGLLGGIEGHESLFDAKILHRDISIGNIMLSEAEDDGFLIDLDLAVKTDREKASGAPSKTGTKVFMAIGALYGEEHSFMHDLESFFWVLFWLCVHWNGPGQERTKTEYESWNFEPTKKLAREKAGLVGEEDKFDKDINENFTPYCTSLIPCIQKLRKVAFPKGRRWLTENRRLYTDMKRVLEEAVKELPSS